MFSFICVSSVERRTTAKRVEGLEVLVYVGARDGSVLLQPPTGDANGS